MQYVGIMRRKMAKNKLTTYEADSFFCKVQDEYDFMAQAGKMMDKFNISMDMKDKLKDVLREAIDFGFNLGIKEAKWK